MVSWDLDPVRHLRPVRGAEWPDVQSWWDEDDARYAWQSLYGYRDPAGEEAFVAAWAAGDLS